MKSSSSSSSSTSSVQRRAPQSKRALEKVGKVSQRDFASSDKPRREEGGDLVQPMTQGQRDISMAEEEHETQSISITASPGASRARITPGSGTESDQDADEDLLRFV